jgi:nitroimidazol reductase NimA-like FMN-containing flavoprotein (pyridoxamine 5'-phosphate oxidase superfamily)
VRARDVVRRLDPDECLRRLSTTHSGRLAITSGALPRIVPVEYTVDGGAILLHCRRDSEIFRGARDKVVAFEASGPGPGDDGSPGWSVSITGIARDHNAPEGPAGWLLALSLEGLDGVDLAPRRDQLP